jgi:hypothetical protein
MRKFCDTLLLCRQPSDQVCSVSRLGQTRERHFGAGSVILWTGQESVKVCWRPCVCGHANQRIGIPKACNCCFGTINNAVQMRAGAVGAINLVTRFALGKYFFACACISRGIKLVKAWPCFSGSWCFTCAGVNRVGLCCFAAMASAGGIECRCSPASKHENQKRATAGPNYFGHCHRVEHVAPRFSVYFVSF